MYFSLVLNTQCRLELVFCKNIERRKVLEYMINIELKAKSTLLRIEENLE